MSMTELSAWAAAIRNPTRTNPNHTHFILCIMHKWFQLRRLCYHIITSCRVTRPGVVWYVPLLCEVNRWPKNYLESCVKCEPRKLTHEMSSFFHLAPLILAFSTLPHHHKQKPSQATAIYPGLQYMETISIGVKACFHEPPGTLRSRHPWKEEEEEKQ